MAKKKIKPIFKSRTLWVAVAQGVVGILAVVLTEYPELGGVVIVKSIIDFGLRYITKQPVK